MSEIACYTLSLFWLAGLNTQRQDEGAYVNRETRDKLHRGCFVVWMTALILRDRR